MRYREAAAIALAAGLGAGCAAAVYRPTEPRPALGPGVLIDVVAIHPAKHGVEVSIRTQQPTLIGPITLSTAERESCSGGDANGGLVGPFASVSLFAPRTVIPGFAPPRRPPSHGPELFAHRPTAFGRGPTESAWMVGFGWRLEGWNWSYSSSVRAASASQSLMVFWRRSISTRSAVSGARSPVSQLTRASG